jgi:acetylglutamate kinase
VERIVLKIGGSELDRAGFVDDLLATLAVLRTRYALAVVHGGGKAIARLQGQLCLQPRFIDGLRVTDDESLDVAEMVLSGWVNKRLVARLVHAGIPALGISGVDNGLFRVVKMNHHTHDLGWVGRITETHPDHVIALMDRGVMPVISPISLGVDGHTYNVNADHAAAALACALQAGELAFVSDVPGVLVGGGSECATPALHCVPALTPAQVESLIEAGEIHGGMIPKVRSALSALEKGVTCVRITDLAGLAADGGTCFLREH